MAHLRAHVTGLSMILMAACASIPSGAGRALLSGDTGDRLCGDSTYFAHTIGNEAWVREGMLLSPDSLRWSWTTSSDQLWLEAPIDGHLVIREAVLRSRIATDSLLKNWTSQTGRLEIRSDSATYAVGDKEAHVQHGPIARDAAVMMMPSAAFSEILIRRARMTGRDSVEFPAYFLGANYTPTAVVRFIRRDSVRVGFENDHIVTEVSVDSVGRILSGHYRVQGDSDVVNIRRLRCSK